jgi:hypothetical protein
MVCAQPSFAHNRRFPVAFRTALVTVVEPCLEIGRRPCDNQGMTKAALHELVDRLPDGAV